MMFVEKYKAKSFDEIVEYGDTIKQLVSGEIPHLLFYGPPGVGKSLSANIIVNHLELDYKKLNASDERGIDLIRGKLKDFAMSASRNGKIKIIWLDEFDKLTKDAYDAFRGFIEEYQLTTRFICTCNYIHNIPEAIQNRFTKIEFKYPDIENTYNFLKGIVENESISIGDDTIVELIKSCKGSVRSSINKLEQLSKLNRRIELTDLKNDTELVEKMHLLLQQGNFPEARQVYLNSNIEANEFVNDYHSYIMDLSIKKNELSPEKTKQIIDYMFNYLEVVNRSAISDIVVDWLLLKIIEVFK